MKTAWIVVETVISCKGKPTKYELKSVTTSSEKLSKVIDEMLEAGATSVHEWNSEPNMDSLKESVQSKSLVTHSEWVRMHWEKP